MKGAVVVDGRRIEIGDRVRILSGPYTGCAALFKGRSPRKKGKLLVLTMMSWQSARILVDEDAIRREEVRR
jgi:transcription antitermination factor NusG